LANYTITKRTRKSGTVYCARVRSKEHGVVTFSKSKTFNSKVSATKWAKEIVHKVERNLFNEPFELIDCTLEQLINEYLLKKQDSDRPLGRTTKYSLKQITKYPIAKMLAKKITSADIVDFCLARKNSENTPSPQTIAIDVSCLRKVLKIAKSMFNVNATETPVKEAYPALHDLQLIARSTKRDRRLTNNEIPTLLSALKEKEGHHSCIVPYADIFKISLLTCCRIGEVCNFLWEDLDESLKSILVRDRKNPNGSFGNHSILPLLGDALEIIKQQPKIDKRIFPFNPRTVTAGFRRTRKQLGIQDLRYHDLRREGASQLIEAGFSVEETARVTGHKDLNVLWQVYVSIQPEHFLLSSKKTPVIFKVP
jgi:integrase